jgi:hypothetical protein
VISVEEKKAKQIKWLLAGLFIFLFVCGSTLILLNNKPGKSSVPLPDPETGILNWINAVNGRNIDRVYDLAPDEIKQHVTLAQFKDDNLNNTYIQPGSAFLDFNVIDKKQNGTYAQIITQVWYRKSNQSVNGTPIPINYKFALYYQHGEWKIWTLPW